MPADRRNPASCLLAYASECAHQQGYWEAMGDALFAQGGDFDREQLVALASQLGVDTDRFTQCIDAPETKARIMADAQVGIDAGVDGTPTFFLNGHRVVGSRDSELFDLMMKSVTQRGN
jgi:protein-disulfide isomerase